METSGGPSIGMGRESQGLVAANVVRVSGGDAGIGAMNMGCRFLGRRCQLSGKHNPTGFMLLGQMFCNFGMECFDIADHAQEKPT